MHWGGWCTSAVAEINHKLPHGGVSLATGRYRNQSGEGDCWGPCFGRARRSAYGLAGCGASLRPPLCDLLGLCGVWRAAAQWRRSGWGHHRIEQWPWRSRTRRRRSHRKRCGSGRPGGPSRELGASSQQQPAGQQRRHSSNTPGKDHVREETRKVPPRPVRRHLRLAEAFGRLQGSKEGRVSWSWGQ